MAHEARQYAQRNRQGSSWFSHDDGAVDHKPAPAEPAAAAPAEVHVNNEDNVDKSPTAEADAAPATAPPTARAQMIRPKCDSNDWFVFSYCSY